MIYSVYANTVQAKKIKSYFHAIFGNGHYLLRKDTL